MRLTTADDNTCLATINRRRHFGRTKRANAT